MVTQIKRALGRIARPLRRWYLSIGSARHCPVCGWTGHAFIRRRNPHKPADSFTCPSCGSHERHRFACHALGERLPAFAESTLHFAPERCIAPWLRSISREYLSVDLSSPDAMRHMDITALELDDASVTLVWCSHVLEHVPADRTAISEIFRVLRPGGAAVIMVPIGGAVSDEDPTVTDPMERLRRFRQKDHVRLYGLDIVERLKEAGFEVEVITVNSVDPAIVERSALDYPSTREIFLCTKPS